MLFGDIPLVGMLKQRMAWHEARQNVLAQNVANADTPNYRSRDLKEPVFGKMAEGAAVGVQIASTNPMHFGSNGTAGNEPERAKTYEITPEGNGVVLEEEVMRVSQNVSDFQMVSDLYNRGLGMLKTAISFPRLKETFMDFLRSISIAASGLKAQSGRMRIISENIANADSTANVAGGKPYQRKVPSFRATFDQELGAQLVELGRIDRDRSAFGSKYEPGHPAANAAGYVLTPNVDPLVEQMDFREAQRSYEANLGVIGATRRMVAKTLEILRA